MRSLLTDFMIQTFPIPEPVITGNATRVMSLRDGTKMSKSDPSEFSRIDMTDDENLISKKILAKRIPPFPESERDLEVSQK